uniref:Apolipoprotein C-III n=1 Tax=Calidris pygmaea TaxID=425635 RepID=A0A8C3PHU7_9CHAR
MVHRLLGVAAQLREVLPEHAGHLPEALLRKVQEYAQKATAMAKNAFSRVQESEVAQQARRWLAENAELAKQRLGWLKEKGSIRAGGPTPDPPSTVTVLAIKQR